MQLDRIYDIFAERGMKSKLKTSFWEIKLFSEQQKDKVNIRALSNLNCIIDQKLSANYTALQNHTSCLQSKMIFKRMVKGVMGKYIKAFQKLKDHKFRCRLAEVLSDETLKRLTEKVVRIAEGTHKGLKHQGYEKLVKNKKLFDRQIGIVKRIVNKSYMLMSMGYNKLLEDASLRRQQAIEKMRFIVNCLRDKDSMYILQAYNAMLGRKRILDGVGIGSAIQKRNKLVKRLMDKGYDMQIQAINALKSFLKSERNKDHEIERIAKRMIDSGVRLQG